MFTGIIEDLGTVLLVKKGGGLLRLTAKSDIFKDQKVGDSISINGVCLTISDLRDAVAAFDVMDETIKKSNLGTLKAGDRVNLERALKIGARLSGHFVTGHIDCIGKIIEKASATLKVKISKEDMQFIVPRGSIALDGISLTVGETALAHIAVYLIPHTIKNTTLGFKEIGDFLNIEFDLVGKYILNYAADKRKGRSVITEDFLREHGF